MIELKKEQEMIERSISLLFDEIKYVKSIDFEKTRAEEIVQILQKYLRQQLLSKLDTKEVQERLFDNLFKPTDTAYLKTCIARALAGHLDKLLFFFYQFPCH